MPYIPFLNHTQQQWYVYSFGTQQDFGRKSDVIFQGMGSSIMFQRWEDVPTHVSGIAVSPVDQEVLSHLLGSTEILYSHWVFYF